MTKVYHFYLIEVANFSYLTYHWGSEDRYSSHGYRTDNLIWRHE